MEELLAKHRAERKDLQNKITSKKKNATKKTRKGVNDECENLERELKERQQAELDASKDNDIENGIDGLNLNEASDPTTDTATPSDREDSVSGQLKQVRFEQNAKDEEVSEPAESAQRGKKPNRQKARLARRAAEQEAAANAAAEEAANLPDLRDQEITAMKKQQQKLGLTETFIKPDGHCLYSAIAHGMPDETISKPGPHTPAYQNVRVVTADFITKHPDDFSAFLEEPLDSYVKKIRDTAEWGGQLELQAIARAYGININVLQADGRIEKIEAGSETKESSEIWLAYYKHSFGLGEHYNALNKALAKD